MTIDGYTQDSDTSDTSDDARPNTLEQGNNAVLKIELAGTSTENGLRIQGANSTVKGLIINRFSNPGVWLQNGATGNKVEGNYIGTDAAGTADQGNLYGVLIEGSNNTLGGTEAGTRNIISGNGGDGVEVSYYRDSNNPEDNDLTPPVGNSILSNSIYDNDALGIDLATPPNEPPGVTENDARDRDKGANGLQNYPTLLTATTDGTTTTITGKLKSTPRKFFTIQFFSSGLADTSNFGEGEEFLDEITVKTNRKGSRSFTFQTTEVSAGEFITATATRDSTGDTSEFSNAMTAN